MLNFGLKEELIEFAKMKRDLQKLSIYLISTEKYDLLLSTIESLALSSQKEEEMENILKIFFNYISLLIENEAKKTIKCLCKLMNECKNICKNNIYMEIVRAYMGIDIKNDIVDGDNYEVLLSFLRSSISKPPPTNEKSAHFLAFKNMHNIYILLLSMSEREERKEEIVEYMKKCLAYSHKTTLSPDSKPLYIDLDFSKKIFEKNKKILSLIFALNGEINESIKIALRSENRKIAMFVAKNVEDEKVKKNVWIKIFKSNKEEDFTDAKEILDESNGILKIEDVLPYMVDKVKLKDFKIDLQRCINIYEEGIAGLTSEIRDFNKSALHLDEDIKNLQKRFFEVKFRRIKCEICQCRVRKGKFLMFPCGHIFDVECFRKALFEFEEQKIGNSMFKSKVSAIRSLSEKIDILTKKKENSLRKQREIKPQGGFRSFIGIFGGENSLYSNSYGNNVKYSKNEFNNDDEEKLKEHLESLYQMLEEQCVLCGEEMIESVQEKLLENSDFDEEEEN